jgi:hypothetical protein
MRRGSGALIGILILAASVLFVLVTLRAARGLLLRISLTPLSLSLISTAAIVGVLGMLVWWYLPMGRRPHKVPYWNDQYHRRSARAARAFSMAALCGAAMAALSLFAVAALLPSLNAPVTHVISGGVVIDRSSGTWRCTGWLTLQNGVERRYVCACPRGDCVKGFSDDISKGNRIDLEVSENWAGTVVVGLIAHGI